MSTDVYLDVGPTLESLEDGGDSGVWLGHFAVLAHYDLLYFLRVLSDVREVLYADVVALICDAVRAAAVRHASEVERDGAEFVAALVGHPEFDVVELDELREELSEELGRYWAVRVD